MNDAEDFIIKVGQLGTILTEYRGPGGDVTVPEGVTVIGAGAFRNCRDLTSVSLPGSLRAIRREAFAYCFSLRQLFLPEGLKSIGPEAFRGCGRLEAVALPESLESIGNGAFLDCLRLEAVGFPKPPRQPVYFGPEAFRGCPELVDGQGFFCLADTLLRYDGPGGDVTVPEGVTVIGAGAFRNCRSLTSVSLPEGLLEIGSEAFAYCGSLRQLCLPEGLKRIGPEAFRECGSLEAVALPESLESIGRDAFLSCEHLRSVTLPKPSGQPVRIGERAFSLCRGLADENGFCIVADTLFWYVGPDGNVTVPEGVKRIEGFALAHLSGTVRLSLPDSVSSVDEGAFASSRLILRVRRWRTDLSWAVRRCDLVGICADTAAGIPSRLRRAAAVGAALWPDARLDTADARADMAWLSGNALSLMELAFAEPELLRFLCGHRLLRPGDACAFLAEARERKLPEPTDLLQDYANALGPAAGAADPSGELPEPGADASPNDGRAQSAAGPVLLRSNSKDFDVHNGVLKKYLGPGGDVTVPEGVTEIAGKAFRACAGLTSVTLPEGLAYIGSRAFEECADLKAVVFPAHPVDVKAKAFRGCPGLADENGFVILGDTLYEYAGPGGDVTVPEGVTKIDDYAFSDREILSDGGFRGHAGISSVRLPEGLESIGNFAFNECVNLKAVNLPEGLRSIGVSAFGWCRSLMAVSFPDSLEHIGSGAFGVCESLETVSLPGKLRSLEEGTFARCTNLVSVSLPDGLRSIGEGVFRNCPSLVSVSLPESLRSIGDEAFRGCLNLRFLWLPKRLWSLGTGAFSDCRSLMAVSLPKGLKAVPERAFAGCESLKAVSLPEGLRSVGTNAFLDCVRLERVSLPERPVRFDADAFTGCRALTGHDGLIIVGGVLCGYTGPGGTLTVPEGVTRIGTKALAHLPGLVRLSLPDSLTSVAEDAFERSRLVIRIRRWFTGLTRTRRYCAIAAICTETVEGLPSWLRRDARLGAAYWPEASFAEKGREDRAWLFKNAGSLVGTAISEPELLYFLCRQRLIPPKDADAYLEEARTRNSPEAAALLLDYVNDLGPEAMEKARARRRARVEAAATARARRLAALRPEDGVLGLRIVLDWRGWDDPQQWLEEHGVICLETPTLGADFLLTDEPASELAEKAAAMGIPMISTEELSDYEGDRGP